jgi:hypothetical protein
VIALLEFPLEVVCLALLVSFDGLQNRFLELKRLG